MKIVDRLELPRLPGELKPEEIDMGGVRDLDIKTLKSHEMNFY